MDQASIELPQNANRRKTIYDEMDIDEYVKLTNGKTWGQVLTELTGGANLVQGKPYWELAKTHKHDIDVMTECCLVQLKMMEQANEKPAPYYFERVAILSRKQKDYQKEINILELYHSMMARYWELNIRQQRYPLFEERLQKARLLALRDSEKLKKK